jgi:hypothetical protein
MPKSKLSAFLSLALVFLSGVLVGSVVHRLYEVKTVSSSPTSPNLPPRRMDPEEARKHIVAETKERCKLDDQQVAELNKIYDQTREQFDALHKKANAETRALWDNQTERIKAILRPNQVPLFDQLRAEREAERHRRKQQQGPPGTPGDHR